MDSEKTKKNKKKPLTLDLQFVLCFIIREPIVTLG